MKTTVRPLCDRCRDSAAPGHLEDPVTGAVLGRCPCRHLEATPGDARDQALTATAEANPGAHRAALLIISDAATTSEWVTANLLRARLDAAGITGPVVGAAFRQAARDGLIRRDGYEPSSQVATHGHPVARWRSLIYRGAA